MAKIPPTLKRVKKEEKKNEIPRNLRSFSVALTGTIEERKGTLDNLDSLALRANYIWRNNEPTRSGLIQDLASKGKIVTFEGTKGIFFPINNE